MKNNSVNNLNYKFQQIKIKKLNKNKLNQNRNNIT